MKLKDGFITYEANGEQMMVAAGHVGFHGMVRGNRTAAFIIDCLKEETTQEATAEATQRTEENALHFGLDQADSGTDAQTHQRPTQASDECSAEFGRIISQELGVHPLCQVTADKANYQRNTGADQSIFNCFLSISFHGNFI